MHSDCKMLEEEIDEMVWDGEDSGADEGDCENNHERHQGLCQHKNISNDFNSSDQCQQIYNTMDSINLEDRQQESQIKDYHNNVNSIAMQENSNDSIEIQDTIENIVSCEDVGEIQ